MRYLLARETWRPRALAHPDWRHAVVFLFVLTLALSGANLFWTAHTVSRFAAQQKAAAAAAKAAQKRQGEATEHKICLTLHRLGGLQPPPGSPSGNPSRAYLQAQHHVLDELGPDLGCR